ncbi:DUF2075 domain-containing protein [Bacillus sp. AGMB 02131]|uniref:DUF2075 domain-containing protein n=1 Tax=Peribacillus faecalis TaxID=2772559 RepID=A0A927HAF5_9BACI|nr:DNA/RNA helicase domain-containing protein [Peribacillus faecalis]MBD3107497.1 DUF2075 domain-containing protein [Peribacillus faecalis]
MLASSKSQILQNFGIDNSFYATSKVNFGDWYNKPQGEEGSCCNLETVVTEFGCQGLELDLPIVAWGEDMIWEGTSWKKYEKYQKDIHDPDKLRKNSYRVLMTRGRDGLIIFVPNIKQLDGVYTVLQEAGMDKIR